MRPATLTSCCPRAQFTSDTGWVLHRTRPARVCSSPKAYTIEFIEFSRYGNVARVCCTIERVVIDVEFRLSSFCTFHLSDLPRAGVCASFVPDLLFSIQVCLTSIVSTLLFFNNYLNDNSLCFEIHPWKSQPRARRHTHLQARLCRRRVKTGVTEAKELHFRTLKLKVQGPRPVGDRNVAPHINV
jgi:hypothetical protein